MNINENIVDKNIIGKNIRKIRKSKGMTMKELGKIIDISEQGIGNYERGDRTPNIGALNKIATALDVRIHDLLKDPSLNNSNITNKSKQEMFLNIENFNNSNDINGKDLLEEMLKLQGKSDEFIKIALSDTKKAFPIWQNELNFLASKNVQDFFSYSFYELVANGYDELLIKSIEKAIKTTIEEIDAHIKNGDIFDGVSSWISKKSPAYEFMKNKTTNK